MQTIAAASGQLAVKDGLATLAKDIELRNLSDSQREAALGQLKALGRDVNNVKQAYDAAAVKVLGHYGFGEYSSNVRREALRCIANALILVPSTQEAFASQDFLRKTAELLGSQDDDDEFLSARILFLMTYTKSTSLPPLAKDYDMPGKIVGHLQRHVAADEPLIGAGITSMALAETLKLVFNLVNLVPDQQRTLLPAVSSLHTLLNNAKVLEVPLQPPMNYLLNALASLETEVEGASKDNIPDNGTLSASVDKLVVILEQSLKAYANIDLDTQLISLLTILRRINATGHAELRTKMKGLLLPKDAERDKPLGQSETLASKLLKLTTAPGLVHLSEAVSSLLFELSDKDAHTFVRNVGYGYAAGYLMTHKIPIPENAKSTASGSDDVPINPVTGQRLDKEAEVEMPAMSQEEKEREAERLFVLFERLKATGVVDVKNPVEQVRDEGRLKDSSDSEAD
jgi:hypothetical protein